MVTWDQKALRLKEKLSQRTMFYALIIFAISIVIFDSTSQDYLLALFGFLMIVSGAVIVLFVLVYLILKILKGLNRGKEPNRVEMIKKASKKSSGSKVSTKKVSSKKKAVTKKKLVSKKKVAKKK